MPRDDFTPPRPYTVVRWVHQKGEAPSPALVTAVFDKTISCTVFPLDFTRGVAKDGVRHVDDPIAPHVDPAEGGGYWDYTEDQKLIRTMTGEDVGFAPKK